MVRYCLNLKHNVFLCFSIIIEIKIYEQGLPYPQGAPPIPIPYPSKKSNSSFMVLPLGAQHFLICYHLGRAFFPPKAFLIRYIMRSRQRTPLLYSVMTELSVCTYCARYLFRLIVKYFNMNNKFNGVQSRFNRDKKSLTSFIKFL